MTTTTQLNERYIKDKQIERLWYFSGELVASFRSGAVVLIILVLILYAPNAAGIYKGTSFIAAVFGLTVAGPNLGNVLYNVYSLFFTTVLICVNCTIGVSIGVNQAATVVMVFVLTFTNFYFIQMSGNPAYKSLAAGITNAFLVVFHGQRVNDGLPRALANLWWNMTSWGVPSLIAIGIMLIPYPALATISLKKVTEKLTLKLIYTVNIMKLCAAGASQNSENFRNGIHLLNLNVFELKENLTRAEALLKDARWELIVSGCCQKTYFLCSAKIKIIRELTEHLDHYFLGVRYVVMRYIHHEENARIFFREVAGAYRILAEVAEAVLTAQSNEEIRRQLEGKMKEFEDIMIFARVNMIRNQVLHKASISHRKLFGHVLGLQLKPYSMMQLFCAWEIPSSSFKEIWTEFKPLLRMGVFATAEQLLSWERFIESLKFAAVAGIAQLLTYLFPQVFQYGNSPKDFYTAMTVGLISVVQSSGSTIQKCIFRVIGTSFGGIFTLFVFLVSSQQMIESGIFPSFMFAINGGVSSYFTRNHPQIAYAAFVMGITPLIISLEGTEYFQNRDTAVDTLIVRLLDTGVAAGLTIMAAMIYSFPAITKLHNFMTKLLAGSARVLDSLGALEVSGPPLVQWNQDMARLPLFITSCDVDPALWRIQFSVERFSGVKRSMLSLIGVLNTMEKAVIMMKSRQEEWYFSWVDKRLGIVNKEIIELLSALSECFQPPGKRSSDSTRIPVMLVDIIDKFKLIRIAIEKDFNKVTAVMVERSRRHMTDDGLDSAQYLLARTDILPSSQDDEASSVIEATHHTSEYFANITYQSVAIHALLHEFFNLCDVLRELTTTTEAYLASFGLFYLDLRSKLIDMPEPNMRCDEPVIDKLSEMLSGNPV